MTNEELLADLKQFVEATVSQHAAELRAEVTTVVRDEVRRVDEKLDVIQDAIADTLSHAVETTDAKLQDPRGAQLAI